MSAFCKELMTLLCVWLFNVAALGGCIGGIIAYGVIFDCFCANIATQFLPQISIWKLNRMIWSDRDTFYMHMQALQLGGALKGWQWLFLIEVNLAFLIHLLFLYVQNNYYAYLITRNCTIQGVPALLSGLTVYWLMPNDPM